MKMKISKQTILNMIKNINHMLKMPEHTITKTENGIKYNVGNFYLEEDTASGKSLYRLVQVHNETGAEDVPINDSCVTLKELYRQLQGFIAAIYTIKNITGN